MTCLTIFLPSSKFEERTKEIEKALENTEKDPSFSQLDFIITKDEISRCSHTLKNGKSSGLDGITNEMLKKWRMFNINSCALTI